MVFSEPPLWKSARLDPTHGLTGWLLLDWDIKEEVGRAVIQPSPAGLRLFSRRAVVLYARSQRLAPREPGNFRLMRLPAVPRLPLVDEIADRHPFESANKRGESLFAAMEVDALTKSIGKIDPGSPRLPWIDLPRVNVKDVRPPGAQDRMHAREPQGVGNEPEIAAAAPRDPTLSHSNADA